MRSANLLLLSMLVSGCGTLGQGMSLSSKGIAARKSARYADCVALQGRAIEQFDKTIEGWAPVHPRHWWAVDGKANALTERALCRKESGESAAAVADMEEASRLYTSILTNYNNHDDVKERMSSTAELMARWKKELGKE